MFLVGVYKQNYFYSPKSYDSNIFGKWKKSAVYDNLMMLIAALNQEVGTLQKEVSLLKAQLQESSAGREQWEEQVAHLKELCQRVQDRSREKIEVRSGFVGY